MSVISGNHISCERSQRAASPRSPGADPLPRFPHILRQLLCLLLLCLHQAQSVSYAPTRMSHTANHRVISCVMQYCIPAPLSCRIQSNRVAIDNVNQAHSPAACSTAEGAWPWLKLTLPKPQSPPPAPLLSADLAALPDLAALTGCWGPLSAFLHASIHSRASSAFFAYNR